MKNNGKNQNQEKPLAFNDLSKYISKNWKIFVAGFVLAVLAGLGYLFLASPEYTIESTILIKDKEKGSDYASNAIYSDLESFKGTANIEDEVEVIASKKLMRKVLSNLSLFTSVYQKDGFKKKELYGAELPFTVTFENLDLESSARGIEYTFNALNETTFTLKDKEGSKNEFSYGQKIENEFGVFMVNKKEDKVSSLADVPKELTIIFHNPQVHTENMLKKLEVEVSSKKASTVSMAFLASSPKKGMDILNEVIKAYNQEAIEEKNEVALNTISFIDERLGLVTKELEDTEKYVEEFKRANNVTDINLDAQQYLENTTDYRNRTSELSNQIEVLSSIESYLIAQGNNNYDVVPSSLIIQDPTLSALIDRFNETQRERVRLLRNYQPSNPVILNMNSQLDALKSNILENLRNIKGQLEISRRNLQASSNQVSSRIQRLPGIERELLEINRQKSIKQEHYLYLLQKKEEASLSLATTTVANSKVIDPPSSSLKPTNPNPINTMLIAILAGLFLPIGFIVGKESLNKYITEREDVEDMTSIPILGEISRNEDGKVVAIDKSSKTPTAEQFRLIRNNIMYLTNGKNKTILVTSGMSGEGKTFFSINLAVSLALTGRKVVVLDFDLRKPALGKAIGLNGAAGITEYLQNPNLTIQSIIKSPQITENLYAIGPGTIPENPSDIMSSIRVKELIEALEAEFDHVIIDTAPVGLVADCLSLAPFAHTSAYVIRYNYTKKNQLNIINDIQLQEKLNQPLLVLNDLKLDKKEGFGYGYY
ncbi:GumC family protein [Pararhodonellum marinum]|uniref:GumC family protein n=1 Tax=Pararhodonellum marinum TaxID=2755358 RepID=UPI00188FA134|nr:tyrosine-protein kinase [Pararhodonellum marinum]